MAASFKWVGILLLVTAHGLLALAQTTQQLNGNNVCTATLSVTQVQKIPINGMQTKIVRYVTRCGLGLLMCSRYRTLYVPAYREQLATVYRTKNVCCAGNQADNGQCVPRVTTTPNPSLRNKNSSPNMATSPPGSGRDPSYQGKGGSINGRSGRRPTNKNKHYIPPRGGNGMDFPMTSQNDGEGRLDRDGVDYDKSPGLRNPPGGSGMVSVTLGVAVFMSLTGMLVGVLLMKIKTRNAKAVDAIPLTRNTNSRRPTRKKTKSVSGMVSKKSQKQRVSVSYVDIMDIREKMAVGVSSPGAKKRIIPKFSLPRIPEVLVESAKCAELDQKSDLKELKEIKPAARVFPSYAMVRKSKQETTYAQPNVSTSEYTDGSESPGYAKVDEIQFNDCSILTVSEERFPEIVPGSDRKSVNSLYARINKNVNQSHTEHRYSHGSLCDSDVDDLCSHESFECSGIKPDDDCIYGKLDCPLSRSDNDILVRENSFKYDRLRRGPHTGSSRRAKQYSELYESI